MEKKTIYTFENLRDVEYCFDYPKQSNDYYLREFFNNDNGEDGISSPLDNLIRKPNIILKCNEDDGDKIDNDDRKIYREFSKSADNVDKIPVIDQFYNVGGDCDDDDDDDNNNVDGIGYDPMRIFGRCNELEYSSNIIIRGGHIKLPYQDSTKPPNMIRMLVRTYFKGNVSLYTNEERTRVSTKYGGDDGTIVIGPIVSNNLFLRIDEHVPYGEDLIDHVMYGSEHDKTITGKIKVLRNRFTYDGTTYTVMGAVEVPLDDFETFSPIHKTTTTTTTATNNVQYRPFKRLNIIYWFLDGEYRGRTYRFRSAFRRALISKKSSSSSSSSSSMKKDILLEYDPIKQNIVQCNIECEDPILGYQFVECHDALFKYYRYQLTHSKDGLITPTLDDELQRPYNLQCEKIKYLTPDQMDFIRSLRHVPCVSASSIIKTDVTPQIHEFIRMSAIKLYLSSVDDKDKIVTVRAKIFDPNVLQRIDENDDAGEIGDGKKYQDCNSNSINNVVCADMFANNVSFTDDE